MLDKKNEIVTSLTKGIEYLFKKNGVTWVKGLGSISGTNEVTCLQEGKTKKITANNIIIATGSKSTSFPGLKFDEKTIISSTGALSLTKVPKKMIVVGAGIIGLELGSVWSRLGAEVLFIEISGSIGGNAMDSKISYKKSDVRSDLRKILEMQGLKFLLKTRVNKIEKVQEERIKLEIQSDDSEKKEVKFI